MYDKAVLKSSAQTSGVGSAGGTKSEQRLVTKALDEAIRMTQLRLRVRNLTEFHLSESSDKALSVKHAYQMKLRDPEGLSALLFQGSGREPKRANGARRPRRYLQKILVPNKHTCKWKK